MRPAERKTAIRRFLVPGLLLAVWIVLVAIIVVGRGSGYHVKAVFDEARGIVVGGEVKAGGVNIGKVTDVKLGDDGLPILTMEVDADYKLHQGAFANIRLGSNVGALNRFVELTSGNPDSPELPDGSTLGPSETDQPVDLDLATSTLDPKTRKEVGEILVGLDRSLRNRGAAINETLQHSADALGETADLLAQVDQDGYALRTLVGQGRRVVGALAQSPDSLTSAADRLAAVLKVAAGRQAELARTAALFGPALSSARSVFARTEAAIPDFRNVIRYARPVVNQLNPTAKAILPLISALRPLIRITRDIIAAAPRQLRRVRPALRLVVKLLPKLKPVLGVFGPLLDHLRAAAPDTINFFVLGGDASSNYDANGNLVRSSAIMIPTARHPNKIGNADDAPGSLERPFDRIPGTLEGEPWNGYANSFIGGGKATQSYVDPSELGP